MLLLFTNSMQGISASVSEGKQDESVFETEYAVYHLDNPGMIDECNKILSDTRQKLTALLEDTLTSKPDIYIVGSISRFNELVAAGFPDWGAGVAIPELNLIVIKSPEKFNLNKTLPELLSHEYAHLVVSKITWINYPPRWLNEGIAMTVSTEWSWSDNMAMSIASTFSQFIPLSELESMNRFNSSKVQVAYAESYLAVEFLQKIYTKKVIGQLLKEIGAGRSYPDALYEVTGLTVEEFDADYKIYLNQRFNVLSLFMDTIFIWIFLAVVVIVGFFLKFRKRRDYYRKWEEHEQLHSTDFDYGDPDDPEASDDDEPWRS